MTQAAARRGNQTVGNILRSLLPLLVLVLLAVWLLWPRAGTVVHVVDPGPDIRGAAQVAPYHVVSPQGLPSGWRPTSSYLTQPASGVVTLEVGYLSPHSEYARYVQSNLRTADLLAAQIRGATAEGSTVVAGDAWQRYRTPAGELALVRGGPATVLVTGGAGLDELTTLAAALH